MEPRPGSPGLFYDKILSMEKTTEKSRAYGRAYREANQDRIRARKKAYYLANIENRRARQKAYEKKNLDRARVRRGLPSPAYCAPAACECCGKAPVKKALNLDHDHTTGNFRGWLCGPCNVGIGMLGDDATGVGLAHMYLQRSSLVALI